jgi:hypothetical protein
VITVQAASTANNCRAETHLSNSPLTKPLSIFKRTFTYAEQNVHLNTKQVNFIFTCTYKITCTSTWRLDFVHKLIFHTHKRKQTEGKSIQCFGMGEVSVLKWKDHEAPAQFGQLYSTILSLWAQNNKSK